MKQLTKKYWDLFLVIILLTIIYGFTLAPTLFAFDSAELSVAAYSLGIVHSPGYPVYLLIAHLFTYIPLRDVAYRVNLLSAVSTILAIGLLTRIVFYIVKDKLVSIVAGLTFGLSFYVWSSSVIAEVYTLQTLFLSGLIYLMLRWDSTDQIHNLYIAALLAGVTIANNPSTILWFPGLLWIGWTSTNRKHLTKRNLTILGGLFLLGLLPLLYFPLRSIAQPPIMYAGHYDEFATFHPLDLTKPKNILWYLSGQQFSPSFFGYGLNLIPAELSSFAHNLFAAFLGIGIPLGLYGIWYMAKYKRRLFIGLFLIAFCHAFFFVNYRTLDKETMFLPVYFIWVIFLAIGLNEIIKIRAGLFRYGILLLPIGLFLVNFNYIDVYDFQEIRYTAQRRLDNADPDALYIAIWGDASAMEYLQTVNDVRKDVQVINIFLTDSQSRTAIVQNALEKEQTVYISYKDSILNEAFLVVPIQDGFQLLQKGVDK